MWPFWLVEIAIGRQQAALPQQPVTVILKRPIMPGPKTIIRGALRRTPLRRAVMSVRHRGLTNTDVFLASYPRSGNTWIKSLISSCLFGTAMQNFSDTVDPVIPIVGYHGGVRPLLKNSGRIIKTHEDWRRQYRRAIWIVRDPRDVALSEYKFELRSGSRRGTFEEFLADFVRQSTSGRPTWLTHTQSWCDSPLNGTSELLSIRFEDLVGDTKGELVRIMRFLGIDCDDAMINDALDQNSLNNMAARHAAYDQTLGNTISGSIAAVNQGRSGGWREHLSKDAVQKIEDAFGGMMSRMEYDVVYAGCQA